MTWFGRSPPLHSTDRARRVGKKAGIFIWYFYYSGSNPPESCIKPENGEVQDMWTHKLRQGLRSMKLMSCCGHAENAVIQPQNQTRNLGYNNQATAEIVLHMWLTPLSIRTFPLLFLQILKTHFFYEDSNLLETWGLTLLPLQKIPSATLDPAQALASTVYLQVPKDWAHPLHVTPSRPP